MQETIRYWNGTDWQEHVQLLLMRHYGPGEYSEVQDRDGGDFGIEGFSRDGCVYQCYAAEEPLSTKKLYENQRDKITSDINKFIQNKDKLTRLFGPTKISRWILVVPRYESKELLLHSEAKAKVVRVASLPYVTPDFCIHIATEKNFAVELQTLVKAHICKMKVAAKNIEDQDVDFWQNEDKNLKLVSNLERKINTLHKKEEPRRKLKHNMVKHFLTGQALLDQMHEKYPDIYEEIMIYKSTREQILETDSLINMAAPSQQLNETLNKYKNELQQISGLEMQQIEFLVYEAIADWLLRCPLEFHEELA